jgi:hypothetical protein
VNTFRPEVSLAEVRNEVMDACRRALLAAGFTISSNVELVCPQPIDVHLSKETSVNVRPQFSCPQFSSPQPNQLAYTEVNTSRKADRNCGTSLRQSSNKMTGG